MIASYIGAAACLALAGMNSLGGASTETVAIYIVGMYVNAALASISGKLRRW